MIEKEKGRKLMRSANALNGEGEGKIWRWKDSSVEQHTGGMATESTWRESPAQRNWNRCSAVLCDRRMPVKLK